MDLFMMMKFLGINDVISALREDGYEVIVVSTRCRTERGLQQVKDWLNERYIFVDAVMAEKPPAICYVDDRAICFDGDCDKLYNNITKFRTWQESKDRATTIKEIESKIEEDINDLKALFKQALEAVKYKE